MEKFYNSIFYKNIENKLNILQERNYERNQENKAENIGRKKIKTLAVMAAMELEAELILAELLDKNKKNELVYKREEYFGRIYHIFSPAFFNQGNLTEKIRIIVAVCGVGTLNASLMADTMFREYEADLLIHTGIAGALSENLSPLDIVVASSLKFDSWAGLGYCRFLPYSSPKNDDFMYPCDFYYLEKLKAIVALEQAEQDKKWSEGLIVTSDRFIGDKEEKLALIRRYPEALACEMEGAASARLALLHGKSCLVLRCISDRADQAFDGDYALFERQASFISARITLRFLDFLINY